MTVEEKIKWAEEIPIEILYEEIRKRTRLTDLKFTSKIVERNNGVRILFESQDLSDKVGFLKLMFSEIKIAQFNSEIIYKSYDNEDPILRWWGTVQFSYTHPSGGSNGCTFMTFWYDDIHKWQFD